MIVYRLHHNGNVVNFFDSLDETCKAIRDVLDQHRDLTPEKIFNVQQGNKSVIIFQYWTLYTEMFLIEEIEK